MADRRSRRRARRDRRARFAPPRPPGPHPRSWGEPAHARELLQDAFEPDFIPEIWTQAGESGEQIWHLLTTASPPFKTLAAELEPGQRAELHAAWVEFYERHRTPDGIRVPHGYLVIVGQRRDPNC